AAVKFFIYTVLGGLLMFAGILVLAFHASGPLGHFTFDLAQIQTVHISVALQRWLFLAFFAAFAIKVPLFPVHTWLPDAHTEAPTAGSVILAGVLLKLGGYGFLRYAVSLFPHAAKEFAPWIVALALIGIIYGALVATMQRDLKRLEASPGTQRVRRRVPRSDRRVHGAPALGHHRSGRRHLGRRVPAVGVPARMARSGAEGREPPRPRSRPS